MTSIKSFLAAAAVAITLAIPAQVDAQTRRTRAETPLELLASANDASRQRPSREGFQAARHVYNFEPGAIYELYTNPNYVSTILLEPGESLTNIAAGDTARWIVSQADAEAQGEGRTIVLVKPQEAGLRTNVVLITDRRTYLIEAISQAGAAYSAQVAWSYPQTEHAPNTATPLDALNFNYRIRTTRGPAPQWAPVRVFDDGRRTWIEFASAVEAGDLPPLFVISGEGAELVNYRVIAAPNGPRYMVDRILDVGELRLGTRAPIIVRIERNPSPPVRRRRSARP
ncbi:MAG: TrbG/VirB9 family P-type conjugative transfer protein [Hyphomonadaceae bacterium JAD_PAG50586_4]|nr:MAG: TrbG/VirB9 family P-type conjugative transfer protein [Hyphomonadaceae bacterium JAD_PAG50586_4]